MKTSLPTTLGLFVLLGGIAEARIETPGSVSTGPFHHAAAVAHQNLHVNGPAARPRFSKAPKVEEKPAPAKERQPLRKRIFGNRDKGQGS
ncbi:MAG: hypothetical protein KGS60_11420 [Verrucomicrobia bacterium]|nr:hypothetical protein [Verrucomicrobiota bacterium]